MLPDLFGPLSDNDIITYFNGKRLKDKWTKSGQIPALGVTMVAQRACVPLQTKNRPNNLKTSVAERRLAVMKLMTALTPAEHAANKAGDSQGTENPRERWNKLHSARCIMSPFANAYKTSGASVKHAIKNQFVYALNHLVSERILKLSPVGSGFRIIWRNAYRITMAFKCLSPKQQ